MAQRKFVIMFGAPSDLYPGCPINPTEEAMEFFAQDEGVETFASLDPNDLDRADALVVPGGVPDVDPASYGEEVNGAHFIEPEMDRDQFAVIRRAVEKRMPILGICRGHQLVAIHFGATLIQDIGCKYLHCYEPGNPRFHKILNVPGSRMYAAYGATVSANSGHHQAIRKMPDCLKITEFWCADPAMEQEVMQRIMADEHVDGTDELMIEAVEHKDYPFLGLQWHPELGGELLCKNADVARVREVFYQMIEENT